MKLYTNLNNSFDKSQGTHNSSHKLTSLSKSKEYARLANQVPTIFNIDNGKKVLNANDKDFIRSGLSQHRNKILNLRNY